MIRVATAPMNWNSDDLPDLRPLVPIEQVLAEMVQAGYEGTEYGTGLPPDPSELAPLLKRYGWLWPRISAGSRWRIDGTTTGSWRRHWRWPEPCRPCASRN